MPDGLLVVDKPAGWTSHDVVARIRRLASTKRVGHAGTLDPLATGVLLVGVGRATRLLGHLALRDKAYDATIRLGQSTVTDDSEGDLLSEASAAHLDHGDIRSAVEGLTGDLDQVPARVSAVKVGGTRSYVRVRAGEDVELPPRRVTVTRFDVTDVRRSLPGVIDLDAIVECSSGTYVRALARDLGAALGVGGHLTALRRTRVGPYDLEQAHTLDELGRELTLLPLADVVANAFPRRDVDAVTAEALSHGVPLPAGGQPGPVGVFGPDGTVLALVEDRDGRARPLVVFVD
ncbi:MAG TPA: tRNA pseudouridine(55) synthase TruB [Acidothermales bacterium]